MTNLLSVSSIIFELPSYIGIILIDMKNSANVIPGQFEAKGHDYRADLARFVREVYALQASDEQLASIEAALRAKELQRAALLKAHDPNKGDVAETGHPKQREK